MKHRNNEVIISANEAINNHLNLLFLNNQATQTRNGKKLTYARIYDLYVSLVHSLPVALNLSIHIYAIIAFAIRILNYVDKMRAEKPH